MPLPGSCSRNSLVTAFEGASSPSNFRHNPFRNILRAIQVLLLTLINRKLMINFSSMVGRLALLVPLMLPFHANAEMKSQRGVTYLIMPLDVELYSQTAGGVLEPVSSWTGEAKRIIDKEIKLLAAKAGGRAVNLTDQEADNNYEQLALVKAVSASIQLHHHTGSFWRLPSKNGQLNWTVGKGLAGLVEETGARYALYVRVRDSYATAERKLLIGVTALFGVGMVGGIQQVYANLIDLQTGQVVWSNFVSSATGDLREASVARAATDRIFETFPRQLQ